MKTPRYPANSNDSIVQPLRDDNDSVFDGVDHTTPIADIAVTDGDRREFATYVPTPLDVEHTHDSDDVSTIPR